MSYMSRIKKFISVMSVMLAAAVLISAAKVNPAVIVSSAQSAQSANYSFDENAAVRIKGSTEYNFRQDKGTRIVLEYTAEKDLCISFDFNSDTDFTYDILMFDSGKKRIYPIKKDIQSDIYFFNLEKGRYYLIIDDYQYRGIDIGLSIKEGAYRSNLYKYTFDDALTCLRAANNGGTELKTGKKYNITVRPSKYSTVKYYKYTAEKNGTLRLYFSFGEVFYRTILVLFDETGRMYYPVSNVSYTDNMISDSSFDDVTALQSVYYDTENQKAYNTKYWDYDIKKGNYFLMAADVQDSRTHSDSYKFAIKAAFSAAVAPPAAPKLSIKTSTLSNGVSRRVELSWNSVSGADSYIIYMSTDKGKTYQRYKTVSRNKTNYTIKVKYPGTLKFAVKSIKTANGKVYGSRNSNIVTAD